MRNRIRQEIHDWVAGDCPPTERDRWQQIEADIDTARIGTIHSLCESILRAHPAEAKVDPGFGVLDEGLAAALKAQTVEDTLDWATQQSELLPLFDAFETRDLEQILTRLLEKRLEASTAFDQSDLVAAWDEVLRSKLNEFATQVGDIAAELSELANGDLVSDAGDKLADQVKRISRRVERVRARLGKRQLHRGGTTFVCGAARILRSERPAKRRAGQKPSSRNFARDTIRRLTPGSAAKPKMILLPIPPSSRVRRTLSHCSRYLRACN